MNGSREKILKRLRAARPASAKPAPLWHDTGLFADYAAAREKRLETFAAQLTTLKAEFFRMPDFLAATVQLKKLLQVLPPKETSRALRAVRHSSPLLDEIFNHDAWLNQHALLLEDQTSNSDFEKIQAGITTARFLVARTGSIVLQARNAGGRRLSVLPPFHIVVAKIEQLVDSLEEVFAVLSQKDQNESSFITIITGPSRTSDIEKTLVLGAHGPKRLAVIVIG